MIRATLLSLLIALTASAEPLSPSPDSAAPKPFALSDLNADQRAAWFSWDRARKAEALNGDLARQLFEVQRKLETARARNECT